MITCPVCRCETILKGKSITEGTAALPTNYAIVGVVEALAQEERLAKASRCQECVEEPSADWRCEVCAVILCNECCYQHSRTKATSAHQTCNIAMPTIKGPPKAMVGSGFGSEDKAAAAVVAVPNLCEDHGEPLKIYCTAHKRLICLYDDVAV